jgi:hypothetical protein
LEIQPERAAFPWHRLNSHTAAHAFRTLAHNSQSDAGSFIAIAQSLEDSKDSFVGRLLNPEAVVFEKQAHPFAFPI